MADVNAPSSQALAMAPPVRTDEEIVPRNRWVQIRKCNCYLDLDKKQSNPIYKMAVDLLMHANFHRAFTASSTIPSIYIQQFWDTIQYDKKAGSYRRHKFHPRPDSPLHLPNEEPVLGYLKKSSGLACIDAHQARQESQVNSTQGTSKTFSLYSGYISITCTHFSTGQTASKKAQAGPETSDKPPKAKKSKYGWVSKKRTLKNVATSEAEDVSIMEPQVTAEDAELQKVMEESIKTAYAAAPRGSLPPVVIRETGSRKYQPLPEVPGKGKAKVSEEQDAHDLLSLQKPKKKSPTDQYILQRCISKPAGFSLHDDSPYDVLRQSDSKEKSEKVMFEATEGGQDGSNPNEMSKGQPRPDPGNARDEEQYIPSPVVYARSDREHMDLDVADISPLPSTEQLDEGFTATAYLKDISFGDLFFSDRPSDANKNSQTRVESMVNVPIQQAMYSISLMTSPIIDLTSRPESPKEHQQFKATTTDTTTTTITITLPPPQAPQ
nr:hypothetical protein [Tanacetum cinerariifolium]